MNEADKVIQFPPTEKTRRVRVLATGADGLPRWSKEIEVAGNNGWGVNEKGCLYLTTGGDTGLLAVYAPHAWFEIVMVQED